MIIMKHLLVSLLLPLLARGHIWYPEGYNRGRDPTTAECSSLNKFPSTWSFESFHLHVSWAVKINSILPLVSFSLNHQHVLSFSLSLKNDDAHIMYCWFKMLVKGRKYCSRKSCRQFQTTSSRLCWSLKFVYCET